MKKILLTVLFLVPSLSHLESATINYSGFEGQFVLETSPSSYSQLPVDTYISIGTFDLSGGFAFNLIGTSPFDSWAEISSYYTEYGNTTIFDSDGYGVFSSDVNVLGIEGTPLYILGFDSLNPLVSTQMAIVGGSGGAWDAPSDDPLSGVLSIDIGGEGAIVLYGVLTDVDGYGGLGVGKDIALSTVPEQSSLAYLALSFSVLLFFGRRFKKQPQL